MKDFLRNRWLLLVLRLAIGGIFVYAGWTKIQQPQAFADSIATFRILPEEVINVFASSLPIFEMIVGLLLIIGWQAQLAAFAVLFVSLVFAMALTQALMRGLQVDCGCFGTVQLSVPRTIVSIARDVLLLGATFLIYQRELKASLEKEGN